RLFSRNADAYHYLMAELLDNIYQHAGADHSYVMAQYYPTKLEIEACFVDDGVSIPGSLERGAGAHYRPEEAYRAILDAIGGLSAKSAERGYGLRTSIGVTNGLGGEALIVSGRGAVISTPQGALLPYVRPETATLQGTLVSIRLREGDRKINLYDFLDI
ncbi:MAG TPA: ATP-binding protein, partial [Thermoplasmata archaeon]|nr:ATP-binding protein [Thermoplasmata archaeon]